MSVSVPVISPAAGAFFGSQQITITCATVGAIIYYTVDGSTPTTNSILYTRPFSITSSKTIQAIAVMQPSSIASSLYTTGGLTSTTAWQSSALKTPETGSFRVEFDAVPNTAAMDGVIGVSAGTIPVTGYANLSFGVRFHTDGTINAISGTGYTSTGNPTYIVGSKYHFILDVSGSTYTASAVSPTGVTTVLGTALTFRQAGTTFNLVDVVSEIGSVTVGNITTSPLVVVSATVSVNLNWLAPSDPVSGYNVYRGAALGQETTKLNSSLVTGVSFIDNAPVKGQNYYAIKPVIIAPDGTPVEGTASNEVNIPIS